MSRLEVLSPVAQSAGDNSTGGAARRPSSLDGLRLGLIWNSKRGGEIALTKAAELISGQVQERQRAPLRRLHALRQEAAGKSARGCDIFIGSTGDRGSLHVVACPRPHRRWKSRQARGGIVSAGFEQTAKATAKAFGLPEFRYARVNHVLTGLTPPSRSSMK
jgi:hypothetical protein